MDTSHFVIVVVGFVLTQVASMIWVIASTRSDMKVIKAQNENLQQGLDRLSTVLERLAMQEERMKAFDDRQNMTGRRLDQLTERVTRYLDRRVNSLGEP